MQTSLRIMLVGFALLGVAACAAEPPQSAASDVASASAAVSTSGVWEFEGGGYAFNCGDECGQPNCNCVGNRCAGNPVNQSCSVIGAECNVVGSGSYRTLECEPVETMPPAQVWRRFTTSSCADQCGAPTCSCIRPTCAASAEGQPCATAGAVCTAISGPSFIELICQ